MGVTYIGQTSWYGKALCKHPPAWLGYIYKTVFQPAGAGLQDTSWRCSQDNLNKAIIRMPLHVNPNDQYKS